MTCYGSSAELDWLIRDSVETLSWMVLGIWLGTAQYDLAIVLLQVGRVKKPPAAHFSQNCGAVVCLSGHPGLGSCRTWPQAWGGNAKRMVSGYSGSQTGQGGTTTLLLYLD